MSQFGWSSPPGTPTGIDTGTVEYICPDCDDHHYIDYTYDRSVNAFELDDPPENCQTCGHEVKSKELDNLEPIEDESDYDPSFD